MKKNILLIALTMTSIAASAQTFQLTNDGYFNASHCASHWDRYLGMTAAMTQVPLSPRLPKIK